ncbi:MAG: prepilin peptidase [Alphaproteobacteria bacterium]|nr:prepilin peptidase [Alphaproteobacteria bacterium]
MAIGSAFPVWIVLLLVAPFIGSFLGVVVVRQCEGVILGRSRCDACGHALDWRDLVPLVSWLALRGRCRHCGARVGAFHPLIELAAIAPVLWAATRYSGGLLAASTILGWLLLALALIDWRTQRLPDVLNLLLALAGLATAWLFDRANVVDHLIGAAAGFAALAAVGATYRKLRGREGLGLGDAKLLGALGAWLSWVVLPPLVLLAALLALGFAVARSLVKGRESLEQRIAFGPFLAAAGWILWLYGPRP